MRKTAPTRGAPRWRRSRCRAEPRPADPPDASQARARCLVPPSGKRGSVPRLRSKYARLIRADNTGVLPMTTKRLTRGQAIRAFCIECMGGDVRLPRECTVTRCALWIYRNGAEEVLPDQERVGVLGSQRRGFATGDVTPAA